MYKNIFWKIICNIAISWWCWWSNTRFKNKKRKNTGVLSEDVVSNLDDIKLLTKKLKKSFTYTDDSYDQLWDAIVPPPQLYEDYVGGLVKDDCDGFHALLSYCLFNNKIYCCLLTANTPKDGHCILLFYFEKKWYVADYTKIYCGYETIEETIVEYNKIYKEVYKTSNVVMNGLLKYDYDKQQFVKMNLKKIYNDMNLLYQKVIEEYKKVV